MATANTYGLPMYGNQPQQNKAQFNPALFGISPAAGVASYFAPQGTSDFLGGLRDFFTGTPQQVHQLPTQTAQGADVLSQLLSMGSKGLQNPYAGFEPIAQQARNNFNQNTVPQLAERFTGGTGGGLSSPSFASQLGQAGAGLNSNLAAQQSQYGQQNIGQLLQMLQLGLKPQFQNFETGGQGGFLQEIFPQLAKAGLGAAGSYATGGASSILPYLMALL